MAKEFYTERDIEDMFKRGIMSLNVTENVALTELAYEKANRLGFKLIQVQPDNPPCAPVRPYIGLKVNTASPLPLDVPPPGPSGKDLHEKIHAAVVARMGNQVDPTLLDVIIERVLKSTGVK
jgi:hypothetical protein